jgi:hypothetical protein
MQYLPPIKIESNIKNPNKFCLFILIMGMIYKSAMH